MHDRFVSLVPPFGIPIDLIHNTNQTINANIGKRAKLVLALYYIYCSLHIEQWLHILIISMACSLQRPKHCKITTFKNLPPLATGSQKGYSWGWVFVNCRNVFSFELWQYWHGALHLHASCYLANTSCHLANLYKMQEAPANLEFLS